MTDEELLKRFKAIIPLIDFWADEVCQASTMSQNDDELLEAWTSLRDDMTAQVKRGPSKPKV